MQIPVAVGKNENFLGSPVYKAANFVHGDDGMGNVSLPNPKVICWVVKANTMCNTMSFISHLGITLLSFDMCFPVYDQGSPVDTTAVDFLVNAGLQYPGEVYVLAIGPLTNVALALQKHPDVANLWVQSPTVGHANVLNIPWPICCFVTFPLILSRMCSVI